MRNIVTARSRTIPKEQKLAQGSFDKYLQDAYVGSHTYQFVEDFHSVVIEDSPTENYIRKLRGGVIMMNDYRKTEIKIHDNPCNCAWHYHYFKPPNLSDKQDNIWTNYSSKRILDYSLDVLNSTSGPGTPPESQNYDWLMNSLSNYNVDSLVNKAILSVHAQLNSSDFQSLVSAAEIKKTVSTFTSVFRKVIRLIPMILNYRRTLSNLSKRGVRRLSKDASRQWLELRYGVRPIAYDMRNLYKAINSIIDGHTRVRFYSKEEMDPLSYEISANTNNFSVGYLQYDYHSLSTRTVEASAGIIADVDIEGLKRVTRPLGLSEITQSAWELVPFSFVVDWFFNVGNLISAWSPASSTRILGSYVTVRDSYKHLRSLEQFHDSRAGGYATVNVDHDGIFWEYDNVVTTRWSNPSVPAIPSLDINLDVAKVADLLALARTLWRKRR